MANLRMITSDGDMLKFEDNLIGLKNLSDEAITKLDYVSPLDVSPLDGYCVTTSNMKFENGLKELTNANLSIWKSKSGKCYALAYATNDELRRRDMEERLKNALGNSCLALGTGSVDANGDTTNISLTLTSATKELRFANQNIVKITDSSGNDEIRINTQGVATDAELYFSQGEDTIKFNGETTVQKISGGGGQTGVHLL